MDLFAELETHVRQYVDGRRSLDDLDDWLTDYAQEIADSEDRRVRVVAGRAWNLISEYGYGDGSEDRVRVGLQNVLAEFSPPTLAAVASAST
jgi:hypothetical protein